MKKQLAVLLALLLLVSLLPVAALAEGNEPFDVIEFEQVNSKQSNDGLFTLSTSYVDQLGWGGGPFTLTISTNDKSLLITRIEAVISCNEENFGQIVVSGTAQKGAIVNHVASVTNINAPTFYFLGVFSGV